jgi:hypothetical protein
LEQRPFLNRRSNETNNSKDFVDIKKKFAELSPTKEKVRVVEEEGQDLASFAELVADIISGRSKANQVQEPIPMLSDFVRALENANQVRVSKERAGVGLF